MSDGFKDLFDGRLYAGVVVGVAVLAGILASHFGTPLLGAAVTGGIIAAGAIGYGAYKLAEIIANKIKGKGKSRERTKEQELSQEQTKEQSQEKNKTQEKTTELRHDANILSKQNEQIKKTKSSHRFKFFKREKEQSQAIENTPPHN